MNCILQIMVHCPLVARFFLGDRHNRFECLACHGNVESGLDDDAMAAPRRACLACEMDMLLTQCFSGDTAPYSPHSFLHAMWCSCDHFAGYEQQDAHEFWIAVFSGICASLGLAAAPLPLAIEPSSGFLAPDAAARTASYDLQSIFSGQLCSQIKCTRCGSKSTKLEDFRDISLDIARSCARHVDNVGTAPPSTRSFALLTPGRGLPELRPMSAGVLRPDTALHLPHTQAADER